MLTGHPPKRIGTPAAPQMPKAGEADSQAETVSAGPVIVAADWQRAIEDRRSSAALERTGRTMHRASPRRPLQLSRSGERCAAAAPVAFEGSPLPPDQLGTNVHLNRQASRNTSWNPA